MDDSFSLRATSRAALEHLAAQIQARYPQAIIQPLSDDPLMLKPGEIVTAVELRPGAASYLPLRAFRERELPTEGTDPLLGLLAAMSHVPAQHAHRDATGPVATPTYLVAGRSSQSRRAPAGT